MQLSSCIKKVEKIVHISSPELLFINANNFEQFNEIREYFAVGNIINVADDINDELPQ